MHVAGFTANTTVEIATGWLKGAAWVPRAGEPSIEQEKKSP